MAILRYRGVEDADRFDSVEMFKSDPDNLFGVQRVRMRYDKRLRVLSRRPEMEREAEPFAPFAYIKRFAWAGVCALGAAEAYLFWAEKNLAAAIGAALLVALVLSAALFAHSDDNGADRQSPRKYY